MTLDAWLYQDPMRVLESKQEAQANRLKRCTACIHHKSINFGVDVHHHCDLRLPMSMHCKYFKEDKH